MNREHIIAGIVIAAALFASSIVFFDHMTSVTVSPRYLAEIKGE